MLVIIESNKTVRWLFSSLSDAIFTIFAKKFTKLAPWKISKHATNCFYGDDDDREKLFFHYLNVFS